MGIKLVKKTEGRGDEPTPFEDYVAHVAVEVEEILSADDDEDKYLRAMDKDPGLRMLKDAFIANTDEAEAAKKFVALVKSEEGGSKKAGEALANLKTFKKDLVYVPEFKNEGALADLVWDIHAQYMNGEDGWEGDAQCFSSVQRVMELTDFPYLIAIGGSDTLYAFESKSDRDCIVSDYLPDPAFA